MSTVGTLYVVATPIGNLDDLTARAREVLCQADTIACEDTRTTQKLLRHIGSDRPSLAYHEHNEQLRADELASRIARGETIALVCDAGTPLLSDPGFRLVRACRRVGLPVVPLPGPSAFLAALSVSGLPAHAFFFAGFPAPKRSARQRLLKQHAEADYTLALYESCHRISKLAADIEAELGGERIVCFARELTKKFETVLVGPISEVARQLKGRNLKGEFVVLVAPHNYQL